MEKTRIEINPNELKPNEFGHKVFGRPTVDEKYDDDIDIRGIQIPPEITPDKVILTGHKRVAGVIRKGKPKITCIVRADLDTIEKQQASSSPRQSSFQSIPQSSTL